MKYLWDTLIQYTLLFIMKVTNFRGDLTDTLATIKSLVVGSCPAYCTTQKVSSMRMRHETLTRDEIEHCWALANMHRTVVNQWFTLWVLTWALNTLGEIVVTKHIWAPNLVGDPTSGQIPCSSPAFCPDASKVLPFTIGFVRIIMIWAFPNSMQSRR